MKKQRHISIRTESNLIDRFYYSSRYYGRTGSGQIVYLIRTFVEEFERDHGKITENDLKDAGIIKK